MTTKALRNDTDPQSITVLPAALDIGAEIQDVDLSSPLTDQQRTEIWDAFVK
jgi:hypothetical protein